jgi:hypothetical protein
MTKMDFFDNYYFILANNFFTQNGLHKSGGRRGGAHATPSGARSPAPELQR